MRRTALALLLMMGPGCTVAWKSTLARVGEHCVAVPALQVSATVVAAIFDALDGGAEPDYRRIGIEAAARFGAQAVLCAVEQLHGPKEVESRIAALEPWRGPSLAPQLLTAQRERRRLLVEYLYHNVSDWTT